MFYFLYQLPYCSTRPTSSSEISTTSSSSSLASVAPATRLSSSASSTPCASSNESSSDGSIVRPISATPSSESYSSNNSLSRWCETYIPLIAPPAVSNVA